MYAVERIFHECLDMNISIKDAARLSRVAESTIYNRIRLGWINKAEKKLKIGEFIDYLYRYYSRFSDDEMEDLLANMVYETIMFILAKTIENEEILERLEKICIEENIVID